MRLPRDQCGVLKILGAIQGGGRGEDKGNCLVCGSIDYTHKNSYLYLAALHGIIAL